MNFYSHQDSYGIMDRTELKQLINKIANIKGTNDYIYCTGWITSDTYGAISKKIYVLSRRRKFWKEEVLDISYKEALTEDINEVKERILDRLSIYGCDLMTYFAEYKVKLGFYKAHVENNGLDDEDNDDE